MKVRDIQIREVATASPDDNALELAQRLSERKLGSLVVVDNLGRPLGIITDRDLMERCIAAQRRPEKTRAGDIMSGPVAWAHEDSPLGDAVDEMARLGVHRLPIIDARERLVGILSLDDVLAQHFADDTPLGRAVRRSP